MSRVITGFALFLSLLAASSAAAQPRCQAAEAMHDATALYECGTEAIRERRYAEAEAYLQRSLEREASVRTAFNLAIALRNLGRARRALGLLRDLDAGRFGEVPDERRESLARQIETSLDSLATVVVVLPAGLARASIEVDAVERREVTDAEEAHFVVEPGEHAILASAEGACLERAVVSVSRGQRTTVQLASTPCPSRESPSGPLDVAPDARVPSAPSPSDDSVLIGVVIGVCVAIAAGGIALGVVLGSGVDAPTCTGGAPCIATLVEPLVRF